MKQIKIIPIILSLIILLVNYSCNEEDFTKDDFEWKNEVTTLIKPVDSKDFIFAINSGYFFVDQVSFMVSVLPGSDDDNYKIQKIELYAYFQETVNSENLQHGGQGGKLIRTFTEVPDFNMFEMTVSIDEIYDLFSADFVNNERPHLLLGTDVIELKWVVTDVEGKVTDKRTDYSSSDNFIFGVNAMYDCEYNFEGIINYEVLEMGSIWTAGAVGDVGTIEITRISLDGTYQVSDFAFGHGLFGAFPGEIYNDNCGDAVRLNSSFANQMSKWTISNVDGATCEIKWTNRLTPFGTPSFVKVKATRADGKDWPANLVGDSTL